MKTRKYVNGDGQIVTSQTSQIVVSGEENKRQQEHEIWYVTISVINYKRNHSLLHITLFEM